MKFNLKKLDESQFVFLNKISFKEIENKSGCYIIWNTELNKYYVGQSIDLAKRINEHFDLKELKPLNYIFAEDFYNSKIEKNKIFKIAFVLHKDLSSLNDLEMYLISLYDCANEIHGYNKTLGGSSPDLKKDKDSKKDLINNLKPFKKILLDLNLQRNESKISEEEYKLKRIKIANQIIELLPYSGSIYAKFIKMERRKSNEE